MQLQEISGINLLTTTCVQKAWPLQNRTRKEGKGWGGGGVVEDKKKKKDTQQVLIQDVIIRIWSSKNAFVVIFPTDDDNLSRWDVADWNTVTRVLHIKTAEPFI